MRVADMHCDTISEIFNAKQDGKKCSLAKNDLHIDIQKMKQGDYLVQNFAMFVDLMEYEDPWKHCQDLIDLFYDELEINKEHIALALNYDDIMQNREAGKLSAVLTVEEGGVTQGRLSRLKQLYTQGVRMLTLTWNYENAIGSPNLKLVKGQRPDFNVPNIETGLTEHGLEFIHEMEDLGMIIDVSHLSDAGFYQVLQHTEKPFVASHSNARNICHHVRNLSDNMIYGLGLRGGVMGINYCPSFLDQVGNQEDAVGTIDQIVRMIKHMVIMGGYECVGLGSDFDGIPSHRDLPDASYMERLADGLLKAFIKPSEIEAIFYKNVLRLYKDVLK